MAIAKGWEALEGKIPGLLYTSCGLTGRPENGGDLYENKAAGEPYFTFVADIILEQKSALMEFPRHDAYRAQVPIVTGMTEVTTGDLLKLDWEC